MDKQTDGTAGTAPRGLYLPECEHDACGVGFVANVDGSRTHAVLEQALEVLRRLTHRGGSGTDPHAGDGAGVLLGLPHELFARACPALPEPGAYGVAMLFLPADEARRRAAAALCERACAEAGHRVLAWREVPVDPGACGPSALAARPAIWQLFVAPAAAAGGDPDALERGLYVLRKRIERAAREADAGLYVCSLSSRTVVYKGLLLPEQLPGFYPDLADPDARTAVAVVHQRFSTNTFPAWHRAHPYRFVAHNGEINTLRGNVHWMRAREAALASPRFGADVAALLPVVDASGSDSAMFDNVLELLVHSGRSLPHAVAMMIPEAWEKDPSMDEARRAFYAYHASLIEPWDGPAAIVFTDGAVVGAVTDRNGLRPARYVVTDEGLVVLASEAGVLDVPVERVVAKGRLQPGRMFLVDTRAGRVVPDAELKDALAARQPYRAWLAANLVQMDDLGVDPRDEQPEDLAPDPALLREGQQVHGYSREDLRLLLSPMAQTGQEAVGSMGNDAPLAVLSDHAQPLFNYFKQLFAQVTNPPIDPIREELVMSLRTTLGEERNLLDETPAHCRQLVLDHPVISAAELRRIERAAAPGVRTARLAALFPLAEGGRGLERALDALCEQAVAAVTGGATVLVLSDRDHAGALAPIPSLLAVAAVHHHLIRAGLRARCGLVADAGDAREVMHFCLLLGYGAAAVHPWLACRSVAALAREGHVEGVAPAAAVDKFLHAANKGILKVMSKMGISTLQSYRGAQIFEAIGLAPELVARYFPGTPSRVAGIGLDVVVRECAMRAERARAELLAVGGQYQWRRDGEEHAYDPDTVASLQHAVRAGDYKLFKKYTAFADAQSRRARTLRGLLRFRARTPVPLAEVEPAHEIVKRFKTGAMSFGSISREAHETLAVAMNRIGARSNSGEGGEDPARFAPDASGDSRRSAIKQVASGRFGVTSHYLVNADELQIKMAQGAKPGEGGQLPGHKVDVNIARLRLSTPGVQLISPPPHHDIYSIEDLAQLIHDLKNANDRARISVKLVAEVGVGTVAAGVAKAKADVILISGDSGGTGAAPLTSIKHAGVPWELGLAEAHQVLVMNGLRGRVRLETDGQLRTGRDVAIAALLGAEEFGFATAALVASGCVMMRVCHLNTCPVGIATQDPELRKRFQGEPEHVINFMGFVAEELREVMAELGFRTIDEMIGRVDALEPVDAEAHWKARGVDLSQILYRPAEAERVAIRQVERQDHGLAGALDERLIAAARPALERGEPVQIAVPVRNTDRTVGTRLSAEVSRRFGAEGLPAGTIALRFEGTAGQSFGAFLAPGIEARLVGEANDHFGKGLSGGRLVVAPPPGAGYVAEETVIVGNVALYGATGGEAFIRGQAGERFAVRNSGATAVVEGVGDHACEYMTRGTVVVLGPTGRNFAAGMSGGVAYVLDLDGGFAQRCNRGMVELEALDEDELAAVRALVHRHYEYTASAVAWRVLAGWREACGRLVKVMPVEYRRALGASTRRASV